MSDVFLLTGEDGKGVGRVLASSLVAPPVITQNIRLNGSRVEILDGGRWRRVVDSDSTYDIREFAPFGVELGFNEQADTDAMKAMFSHFSAKPSTGINAHSAKLIHPTGLLLYIGETLEFIGNSGVGINWEGECGLPRNGVDGSCLYWVGNAGDPMVHFRGANGSVVRNMQFNGGAKAGVVFWSSEYYVGPPVYTGGQIVSSGIFWDYCRFQNPAPGPTSSVFKVGVDNGVTSGLEADSYQWRGCYFNGNGPGPALAGMHIASPGNAKTYTLEHCHFDSVDFGYYQPAGSGTTTLYECQFGNIGWNQDGSAVVMNSGNGLKLLSCTMENASTLLGTDFRARFVSTANNVLANIDGGYFSGTTPTDDYGMILGGPSTVSNFDFEGNSRSGSNVLKVKGTNVVFMGCDWAYNTTPLTNIPLYDGSNSHVIDSDVYRNNTKLPLRVKAFNNLSGARGQTHSTYLPDVIDSEPTIIKGALWSDTANGINSGLTVVDNGRQRRITIPFSLFNAGTLTKTLTITKNTPGLWIKNVQTKVETAFIGLDAVSLEVGISNDTSAHLLPHSMLVLGTEKGILNGDLGASLAPLTRGHSKGHYLSDGTPLQAKMVSPSGNLSLLTAGSVTVVYDYDYSGG